MGNLLCVKKQPSSPMKLARGGVCKIELPNEAKVSDDQLDDYYEKYIAIFNANSLSDHIVDFRILEDDNPDSSEAVLEQVWEDTNVVSCTNGPTKSQLFWLHIL